MDWSPEEWQQEVEALVEKCAQKVLIEIEEEVMGRLRNLSKGIIERICIPTSVIPAGLNVEDRKRILDLQKSPTKLGDVQEPEGAEEGKKATEGTEEGNILWYAFGIIKEERINWPCICGIEDSPCQIIWQNHTLTAGDSQQRLVPDGRLGILVCDVPENDYNETALHEHLQDLVWLERNARRHEQVLLEIMKITTIIPMPLGTIFRGKGQIESQLKSNLGYWRQELTRLIGHYEMQVKLLIDPQKLKMVIVEKIPCSGDQSGGGYFRRRQWEKSIEAEMEGLVDTYSESLFQDLKSLAVAARLLGKEETLSSGLKRIFTAQFLLTQQSRQAWEELLQVFDQKTDSLGFILNVAGPWPIYHFTGIDNLNGLDEEEHNSERNKQFETSQPLASCGETIG